MLISIQMTRAAKPLNLLLPQPETGPGIPRCRDSSYRCSNSSVGSLRGVRLAPVAKYGKVGEQNKMDLFEGYRDLFEGYRDLLSCGPHAPRLSFMAVTSREVTVS